jgi:hypothetical protein
MSTGPGRPHRQRDQLGNVRVGRLVLEDGATVADHISVRSRPAGQAASERGQYRAGDLL